MALINLVFIKDRDQPAIPVGHLNFTVFVSICHPLWQHEAESLK